MPSTPTCLLYHIVFSTKNREPLMAPSWRSRLHDYIGGAIRDLGGTPQGIGVVADHIHILTGLTATHRLADFMRELKKASSIWVSETIREPAFHWEEGYAAFTVSASLRPAVQQYIGRQEERHRKITFREELIDFLEKSGIEYDARYLD